MSKIKFGWSEYPLIPTGRRIHLAGQFYERVTDVVRDPLTVTALAVECGGEAAVFCSCDLESPGHELLLSVRELLRSKADFPLDCLMINAIHTHTGIEYGRQVDMPDGRLEILKSFMPEGVEYDSIAEVTDGDLLCGEEAHAYLAAQIAKAALEAWKSRREGCYASAFGRAAVGMCRRVCYDDGSAKMWGDTDSPNFTELEGGNDSGIELMFLADQSKQLTGVIANIACPAQVLEHRSFISADYWGEVKQLLRKEYGEGIFLLPLCSPAGDQCPRDMIRWVQPESPINDPNIERAHPTEHIADPSMFDESGCRRVARRVANEILWAYEETEHYISDTEMAHKTLRLGMPLRRVTVAEKDAAEAALAGFFKEHVGSINFRDKASLHIHAGTVARYRLQQHMDLDEIEIHILRIGDVAFATNPYELFLDYGNRIRARSHAKQTFLIQLCCGSSGYLPTEKAERGGHYSAYVSSGMSGHEGGELLVRTTVSEINEMMDR